MVLFKEFEKEKKKYIKLNVFNFFKQNKFN